MNYEESKNDVSYIQDFLLEMRCATPIASVQCTHRFNQLRSLP